MRCRHSINGLRLFIKMYCGCSINVSPLFDKPCKYTSIYPNGIARRLFYSPELIIFNIASVEVADVAVHVYCKYV